MIGGNHTTTALRVERGASRRLVPCDECQTPVAELRADWRDTWKVEEWESYRAGNLVGTPEQVCERIEQYSAMGCTAFVTWPNELPDTTSIELFARSVMPEFRP